MIKAVTVRNSQLLSASNVGIISDVKGMVRFIGEEMNAQKMKSLLQGYYSTAEWRGWDFNLRHLFFKAVHLNCFPSMESH